jgi:hypothetical protein
VYFQSVEIIRSPQLQNSARTLNVDEAAADTSDSVLMRLSVLLDVGLRLADMCQTPVLSFSSVRFSSSGSSPRSAASTTFNICEFAKFEV